MKDANHGKKIDSILNEELPVGDEENLKSTSDKTIDISGKRFETINEAVEEDHVLVYGSNNAVGLVSSGDDGKSL